MARHLVFDIVSEDEDPEDDARDDGAGRLAALAPLRAEMIGGDLRFFYLLWLKALEAGTLEIRRERAEARVHSHSADRVAGRESRHTNIHAVIGGYCVP